MLIDEMHFEFKKELNRIDSNDFPDFNPAEVDSYLNAGINSWQIKKYGEGKKEGFETNQEKIAELSNLHILSPNEQPALTPTSIGNNRYEIKLEEGTILYEYYVITKVDVDITEGSCSKTNIRTRFVQTDDVLNFYTKPSFKWKRVPIEYGKSSDGTDNTSLYFLTDGVFSIDDAYISYLKKPARVCLGNYKHIDDTSSSTTTTQTNCDIDSDFHHEIVRQAVLLAQVDMRDAQGVKLKQTQINLDN
jgi:hypothetical protein